MRSLRKGIIYLSFVVHLDEENVKWQEVVVLFYNHECVFLIARPRCVFCHCTCAYGCTKEIVLPEYVFVVIAFVVFVLIF